MTRAGYYDSKSGTAGVFVARSVQLLLPGEEEGRAGGDGRT